MLLRIPQILNPDEVARCRALVEGAEWGDGRMTAGAQSAKAKNNLQLPETHPAARAAGEIILAALPRQGMFVSGALPFKVFPPLFNRYGAGQSFGTHIDNAIRPVAGTPHRVRTDLSATLFLSRPDEYDGGELLIEDDFGAQSVKLPAGDLVIYPAGSRHRVEAVTRGARLASFFWIQSMVRDNGQRTLLFDLDVAIQQVAAGAPDHPAAVRLTGVYHNLLRRWADA